MFKLVFCQYPRCQRNGNKELQELCDKSLEKEPHIEVKSTDCIGYCKGGPILEIHKKDSAYPLVCQYLNRAKLEEIINDIKAHLKQKTS